MIYTRFGTPVKLLTCEAVMETSRDGKHEYIQFYVTAEQSGPSIGARPDDKTDRIGRPILDGKQFPTYELKADGGLGEILDACKALMPDANPLMFA